jgi:hypothetical protein
MVLHLSRSNLVASAVAATWILGACSSGSPPRPAAVANQELAASGSATVSSTAVPATASGGQGITATGTSGTGTGAGTTGAGGGEAPAVVEKGAGAEPGTVTFLHPTEGYRIDSPGPMHATANGEALYEGRNDSLGVALLSGASDPTTAAASDASGSGIPGFALVHSAQAVTVSGRHSAAIEYRRSGPVNAVTGKALVLHVVRLYVPRSGGLYRIEYASTAAGQDWDPQGALDIATTFRPVK